MAETERGRIHISKVLLELAENFIMTIINHMHTNTSDLK